MANAFATSQNQPILIDIVAVSTISWNNVETISKCRSLVLIRRNNESRRRENSHPHH
jgi:hypothetical protein